MPRSIRQWRVSSYYTLGLAILFAALAAVVVALVYRHERSQVLDAAEARARIILDMNLAIHTYFTDQLKPILFRRQKLAANPDAFEPQWMSSSYAVRNIKASFAELGGRDYYYKECVVNARRPENEADAFESAFIDETNRDPHLVYRSGIREFDGAPAFYVLRRGEVSGESCRRCHTDPALAPADLVSQYGPVRGFHRIIVAGEVISAISLRIPVGEPLAEARALTIHVGVVVTLLFLAFYGLVFLFNRALIFAPVENLRDTMIRISEDEDRLGQMAREPAGREYSDLARAFNAMSARLKQGRDLLEQKVRERTSTLTETMEELEDAAQARELLFKESHHRIKNNLQVLSSMINIKMTETTDPAALDILLDIRRRIESIALIHALMYGLEEPGRVNISEYIAKLATSQYRASVDRRENIELILEIADVTADSDLAVPLGLVLNELITNSLKHAFTGERGGQIKVALQDLPDGGFALSVGDDGPGLPPGVDILETGSLGLKLIHSLVEQIDGQLIIDSSRGLTVEVRVAGPRPVPSETEG